MTKEEDKGERREGNDDGKDGDDNFYEMNLKNTSKLAMPGFIAPACFCVVEGDEDLLQVVCAQADDPHLFHCLLLFKVCLVLREALVKVIWNRSKSNFSGQSSVPN